MTGHDNAPDHAAENQDAPDQNVRRQDAPPPSTAPEGPHAGPESPETQAQPVEGSQLDPGTDDRVEMGT